MYDDARQKHYLDMLQENFRYFQTVMVSIANWEELAVVFPGWNKIELKHRDRRLHSR